MKDVWPKLRSCARTGGVTALPAQRAHQSPRLCQTRITRDPRRSAFGIGSHYTYHQRDGLGEASHDYIVGDVTVGNVTNIKRQGWHALVTMQLDGNVQLPEKLDRVLRWIVVTPEMHRVHHSIVARETGVDSMSNTITPSRLSFS